MGDPKMKRAKLISCAGLSQIRLLLPGVMLSRTRRRIPSAPLGNRVSGTSEKPVDRKLSSFFSMALICLPPVTRPSFPMTTRRLIACVVNSFL